MYRELKTERLLLRPMRLTDLEDVHEYASDRDNARYMFFLPNDTVKDTEEFLSGAVKEWEKVSPSFFEFAVELNGKVIGAMSAYLDESKECAELGWILNKKYQRFGYAVEAATALKDFLIGDIRVKKITAHCDARNAPSYRLMEKIGLTRESENGERVYPKTGEKARELTYSLIIE